MKIFAIKNESDVSRKTLAWLVYYEQSKKFYIELPDDASFWDTPLLLSSFLKKGQKSINAYWSEVWVSQRIIPTDRQNLGQILKDNDLKEYNLYELLVLGCGRCSQDDYYLEKVVNKDLPQELVKRFNQKIEDVVLLSEYNMLVFFLNGEVKKCYLKDYFFKNNNFAPLLANETIYHAVKLSPGGNGIMWGSSLEIIAEELSKIGESVPLSLNDFLSFTKERIINGAEAMELLGCSRQNLSDLVRRNKLHPIKSSAKNTLYLKSEIEQRMKY